MKHITMSRPVFYLCLFCSFFFFLAHTTPCYSEEKNEQAFDSVEERRIYSLMQEERNKLSTEKKDLLLREKELKTLETSVDKKIAEIDNKLEELKSLQKRIEALLAEKSKEETKRIKDLSAIYEKMAPTKAALAMTGMDPNLATEILGNMKPKSAAKVMDMLDKNKTTQLSTTFTTIQIE